jgi:hypothetical protein
MQIDLKLSKEKKGKLKFNIHRENIYLLKYVILGTYLYLLTIIINSSGTYVTR